MEPGRECPSTTLPIRSLEDSWRTSNLLSGSSTWTQHAYEALSHDEALELVQMVAAEQLGLL